jgi:hypothetical protein
MAVKLRRTDQPPTYEPLVGIVRFDMENKGQIIHCMVSELSCVAAQLWRVIQSWTLQRYSKNTAGRLRTSRSRNIPTASNIP